MSDQEFVEFLRTELDHRFADVERRINDVIVSQDRRFLEVRDRLDRINGSVQRHGEEIAVLKTTDASRGTDIARLGTSQTTCRADVLAQLGILQGQVQRQHLQQEISDNTDAVTKATVAKIAAIVGGGIGAALGIVQLIIQIYFH